MQSGSSKYKRVGGKPSLLVPPSPRNVWMGGFDWTWHAKVNKVRKKWREMKQNAGWGEVRENKSKEDDMIWYKNIMTMGENGGRGNAEHRKASTVVGRKVKKKKEVSVGRCKKEKKKGRKPVEEEGWCDAICCSSQHAISRCLHRGTEENLEWHGMLCTPEWEGYF